MQYNFKPCTFHKFKKRWIQLPINRGQSCRYSPRTTITNNKTNAPSMQQKQWQQQFVILLGNTTNDTCHGIPRAFRHMKVEMPRHHVNKPEHLFLHCCKNLVYDKYD